MKLPDWMRIVRSRVSDDRRALHVEFKVDAKRATAAPSAARYQPSKYEPGWRFGSTLAKQLGLDPQSVGAITITIEPSEPVTLVVQVFAADLLHSELQHYRLVPLQPSEDRR